MNISKSLPPTRFPAPARRAFALVAAVFTFTLAAASSACAGLISTVTLGPSNAPNTYNLSLEFGNGNYYNYVLRSTAASYTGYDFINAVALLSSGASKITLDQRDGGSLGFYLNGVAIGSDTNSGFVNNSYWAYWNGTGNAPVQWTSSEVGESSRIIIPGQSDGWVYSNGTVPPQAMSFAVPEPATWALLAAASAFLVAPAIRRRALAPTRPLA